jgi:branched-subunit amino acid transport protein
MRMPKLLIFLAMSVATYLTRVTMILALGRRGKARESTLLRRWLRYVPPAILAALIAPPLVAPGNRLTLGPALWAGLVGVGVAWRTRSVLWTILAGMATFWLIQALGAA